MEGRVEEMKNGRKVEVRNEAWKEGRRNEAWNWKEGERKDGRNETWK